MTRAKDISKIITDADFSGTLDVTGTVTAGGLTVDTNTLFVDASTNEVGINTTNPFGELHVRGTSASVYIQSDDGQPCDIIFGDETDQSEGRIRYDSSDNMIFQVDNLREALRISNNGDISFYEDTGTTPKLYWDASAEALGIGTTSPTRNLHIAGNAAYAKFDDTTNGATFTIGSNASGFIVYDDDSANYRMVIDSSGNVGIGTSSPSQKLDVNGTIVASTTSSQGARIERNGSTGGANFDSVLSSGSLHFRTGSTERMRILQDGSNRTRVYIDADDPAQNSYFTVSGNNNTHVMITTNDTSTTGGAAVRFKVNSATVGQISCNASATFYSTSSDHRLKENVTADWDATTRLKQLNPVRFNFIADADTTVDGFLAHEVQSVVPEAITGTHNEVDEDGNPVYQGIDQSKLVPLLVKTIQELEARIEALENA
jgi:hypothetical protein